MTVTYPRILHYPDGRAQRVESASDAEGLFAEGWGLHPVCQEPFTTADPTYVLPDGPIYGRPAVEVEDADDQPLPKKRGRPKKAIE